MEFEVSECERCPDLVENRSCIVNGVGSGSSGVVFVGEAPGKTEDKEGEPFVGRSGEILTELLKENGIDRDEVRITNAVRCRPPDNRNPRVGEIENCRGYLKREIEVTNPSVVTPLGKVATEAILDKKVKMGEAQGEEFEWNGYTVIPSYHPAAVLYDRSKEGELQETMREICERVKT